MGTESPVTVAGVVEVLNAIKVAALVSRTVSSEDLVAFLEQAELENAFGPFFDPTGWMATHKRAEIWTKAARALLAFQREMQAVNAELEIENGPR